MSLTLWLAYLNSLPQVPNGRSLTTVKKLAKKLGLLKFSSKCKLITIAGTNGKGSCVVFLESILMAAGFRVGAYISPHLLRYHERIRLQGEDINEIRLITALNLIKEAANALFLTYFEYTTLAALLLFRDEPLDFIILEVGLGGRLDPVNILDPDLAIITSIAFDHEKNLGTTREQIGYEKSGIMRYGKPVICSKNMPRSIYHQANSLDAKLYLLDKDFFYLVEDHSWHWLSQTTLLKNLPKLQLPVNSAALAVMAVQLLMTEFKIAPEAIVVGLKNSFLPGRWQRIKFKDRELIFDVAHNPEAAELLATNLRKIKENRRILAVVGMLQEKAILQTLNTLVGVVDNWYLGTTASIRAANILQMKNSLQELGVVNFTTSTTISVALQLAIAESQE